jgi:ABC-type Na+ efflux pump permease subunit
MHILMTAFFVFLALMVLNPIVAIAIAAVGLLYGALMYRWWNMSKGQIDGQDSLMLSTFGSCLTANTATAIAWGAAGSIPLWAGIACPVLGIAGLVCIVYLNEKRARELAEQQKLQIQKN